MKKIIHIDMDAFFAAVEQRDDPRLRGRPVIVGGSAERRGVVSTASYEARRYGIHSAMPTAQAKRLCPEGVFIDGSHRKYRAASKAVFTVLAKYTDKIEPMSIDEAFLDVTENRFNEPSAEKLAAMIRTDIHEQTGLTASAGVSYNKFLAKIASGLNKPDGLSVIRFEEAERFLEELPIGNFYGIGAATAEKFRKMNIRSGRDLKKLDQNTLRSHFGKAGIYYYQIVRGIDEREVETEYTRKSYGKEITLTPDVTDLHKIRITVRTLSYRVGRLLNASGLAGRTVTLKVRYSDFTTLTRSESREIPLKSGEKIAKVALALLARTQAGVRPVRLLGVTVSNFPSKFEPKPFFQPELPEIDRPRD